MTTPIRPELFDIVRTYAAAIIAGEASNVISETSPLLTFCDNFFLQFFDGELRTPITGIDEANKRIAVTLRLKQAASLPPETVLLIKWFEHLCDTKDDVLALVYGATPRSAFLQFHREYMTTLLQRAQAWAETRQYTALRDAIATAATEFAAAIRGLNA